MAALKAPAAIHGKSSPTYVAPWSTRRKTAHDTRKERPRAGTATQCARWPVARPKRALTSVPTSGKNGISQTSRDIVLFCTNPPHSSGWVQGCQGRDAYWANLLRHTSFSVASGAQRTDSTPRAAGSLGPRLARNLTQYAGAVATTRSSFQDRRCSAAARPSRRTRGGRDRRRGGAPWP